MKNFPFILCNDFIFQNRLVAFNVSAITGNSKTWLQHSTSWADHALSRDPHASLNFLFLKLELLAKLSMLTKLVSASSTLVLYETKLLPCWSFCLTLKLTFVPSRTPGSVPVTVTKPRWQHCSSLGIACIMCHDHPRLVEVLQSFIGLPTASRLSLRTPTLSSSTQR